MLGKDAEGRQKCKIKQWDSLENGNPKVGEWVYFQARVPVWQISSCQILYKSHLGNSSECCGEPVMEERQAASLPSEGREESVGVPREHRKIKCRKSHAEAGQHDVTVGLCELFS